MVIISFSVNVPFSQSILPHSYAHSLQNILVMNNRKLYKIRYLPVVYELIRHEVGTSVTRIEYYLVSRLDGWSDRQLLTKQFKYIRQSQLTNEVIPGLFDTQILFRMFYCGCYMEVITLLTRLNTVGEKHLYDKG